jgi:hypothetical protein
MGTTVIGGMAAETFVGRFFVPAIFCLVEKLSSAKRVRALAPSPSEEAPVGSAR